VLPRSPSAY